MFSTSTYKNRRQALRQQLAGGILLFPGNIENPINFEHNTYPFRQDSTFLYYFGLAVPSLVGLMDLDENKEIIFGCEATIDDLVWTGPQESLSDRAARVGVLETAPFTSLVHYIERAIARNRPIHFLPPYQSVSKLLLSELLQTTPSALEPSVSFIRAVAQQRSIKEEQEVAEIERAVSVSTEMHLLTMRLAKSGMKESELVHAIQAFAGNRDCSLAYPPIITVHGQILHNQVRSNPLKNGDMVLVDAGAETAMGYAGDLTRTFPVAATFDSQQRAMYQIVLDAITGASEMLRPGVSFKSIHLHAAKILVEGLKGLGLMKGDPEEAVQSHAHTLFFQCGLGHLMGLDVHDMEDLGEQYVGYTTDDPKDTQTFGLKSLRLGKPLEAGFVLTVEPGIYIIQDLIDHCKASNRHSDFVNYTELEKFRNFGGIRLEDNFLITPEGHQLLGPDLIKTIDDVESYRSRYV
ncbi:aminopeptidase P family protein [Sphingobacterium sp. lm-10]|uniref:aminopeptidase P family protein n=1 Tax=Sphingobacterium sp. lm-10 TaxID=2944904 RepID=UPI0020212ADF|nr:aminopeptidase P family protein [Sphingobacterium sp. lm-10]MCL7986734.1 aminopeptidase P family protein [Sphingobacterium sp. lm-10]